MLGINVGLDVCTCINEIGIGLNVGEKYYYRMSKEKDVVIISDNTRTIPMNIEYFNENFKPE